MKIRKFESKDFEKMVEIYDLSKPDEFSEEDLNFDVTPLKEDDQMLKLFEESKIYVYEDVHILGFAGYKDNNISWLFVHPNHRGLKIGQSLISHILTKLRGIVSLNVANSNLTAIKLYEKLGFKIEKVFEGKYKGNRIVVNRMEREI